MDATHAAPARRAPLNPSTLVGPMSLADGRSVLVRPVLPHDDAAEQTFVRGLSPVSRHRRFHIGIHDLPPRMLRAMTDVDQRSHVAVVAESAYTQGAPTIVADARYVLLDEPGEAEFAVAVADAWQGVGLGRLLLRRLMQHARGQGLRILAGDVLRDNDRMISLVRALGGAVTRNPGDATLLQARLPL